MRYPTVLILCCVSTLAVAKSPPHVDAPASQKGCEWAGPDYVKLEGSDTCVKVSGGVRAEFSTSK